MLNPYTPCDEVNSEGIHVCPYSDDPTSETCRNCCGLGVDDNPYPEEEVEFDG